MVNSPESVFQAPGCVAEALAVSDQHLTLLLTNTEEVRSLLKLTVVPTHRDILHHEGSEETKQQAISTNILSFLSSYQYSLTSESGAEYSYYNATPQIPFSLAGLLRTVQSYLGYTSSPPSSSQFKVELISPASERQIQRATPAPKRVMIQETPTLYHTVAQPHIQSIIDGGSLSWIQNVIDGTKEKERLLLDSADGFVLNVDTKWRSHQDAMTVPRSDWYQHPSVEDLYCLAIVKDGSLRSLRDLTAAHLPLLQAILTQAPATIRTIYGVEVDQLRIFVHYHPQFYHFHVHFTRLENEVGCQVERGHLLTDLIQNLQWRSDYYQQRTLTYKLPVTDQLYAKMEEYHRQQGNKD